MGDGGWWRVDGEWGMVNGGWWMVDGEYIMCSEYRLDTVRLKRLFEKLFLICINGEIPLNPPSKGGLKVRFPPFLRGVRGDI